MNRTQRILVGVVVAGAVVIAAIGFAGSYAAVRELALAKGFGWFANVFPVGVDAGIVVLLALDLLLTWLRIPFPLLRQTAWLLTAATIAFNGAAAWPDPLGVGMHGIIPILFVVSVEAARHAIGRIADITADKHMESVRLARWLLAPLPTFRLWRRMKLWELRSYDEVIRLEQERLVYQARLRARYGRAWRRKAPVESLMPLRLARFGVPLTETGPVGLAAAGIEVPSAPAPAALPAPEPAGLTAAGTEQLWPAQAAAPAVVPQHHESGLARATTPAQAPTPANAGEQPNQWFAAPEPVPYRGGYDPHSEPYAYAPPQQQAFANGRPQQAPVPQPRAPEPAPEQLPVPVQEQAPEPSLQVPNGAGGTRPLGEGIADAMPSDEDLYRVFRQSIEGEGMPTPGAFAANILAAYGVSYSARELSGYHDQFAARLNSQMMEDHIA
ncbi:MULTISPECIES: DUF2637 domain-containing protein [unclassified Streptomyces]|uniref:DUF2637 domain-containing protein n=1 Tax=unclassified Streptomyces TaxID=2593676 RepID=UPI0038057FCA